MLIYQQFPVFHDPFSCSGRRRPTRVRRAVHTSHLLACPSYYMVLPNAIQRFGLNSHYCSPECLNWASVHTVAFPQILLLFLLLPPFSFCCWGWLWVNRTHRRLEIERSMINLYVDIILYRWMGTVDRATALQLFYSRVPKSNTNVYEKWWNSVSGLCGVCFVWSLTCFIAPPKPLTSD